MPVPNITGSLHVGHALNLVVQDVFARHMRGIGRPVSFLPGVDHAGLSGQLAAERALEPVSRQDLGRERFLEYMLEWHDRHLARLLLQMRRLDVSAQWAEPVSSVDHRRRRLVQDAFIEMWKRELVYRDLCLVNWCVHCETCIPNEEIERRELTRTAYRVAVFDDEGCRHTLATLHPQLLLGATAVRAPAGHPAARAETIELPVIGRVVPVVVGEVQRDRALGTELSLVLPSYNADDFEHARHVGAPITNIFAEDGTILAEGTDYDGLDDQDCCDRLIDLLEQAGALLDREPYLHGQAHHSLCGGVVVPRATKQWFIRLEQLRPVAAALADRPITRFNHLGWEGRYRRLLDSLGAGQDEGNPWWEGACLAFVRGFSSNRDWMISRQNWWGIPIPASHCPKCDWTHVSPDARSSACPYCGEQSVLSSDVLDVLFHSALWAYCVTPDADRGVHADLAVIGHDILEFWIPTANLLTRYLFDRTSISDVVVHGVICDADGRKMSKSLGNAVNLDVLLAEHGTEVVRALMLSLMGTADGEEVIKMSDEEVGVAVRRMRNLQEWCRDVLVVDSETTNLQVDVAGSFRRVDSAIAALDVGSAYGEAMRVMEGLAARPVVARADWAQLAMLLGPFHPGLAQRVRDSTQ